MDLIPRSQISPAGPILSQFIQGYWRLAEWQFDAQTLCRFIEQQTELGITTVDHASIYGEPSCEMLFGKALKHAPHLKNTLEIVSKFGIQAADGNAVGHYDSSTTALLNSVDGSLSKLGVEQLDILLVHRPDYLMNADELAKGFETLYTQGKVKHFGVSNFTRAQFDLLQQACSQPLVTNQIEINPINLEYLDSGILESLQAQQIRPMAWSCLGGGALAAQNSEQTQRLRSTLLNVADEVNAENIEQVVYAWVLKLPSKPLPILGSGKIARTENAIKSLSIDLTHEQWYRILVASRGQAVP